MAVTDDPLECCSVSRGVDGGLAPLPLSPLRAERTCSRPPRPYNLILSLSKGNLILSLSEDDPAGSALGAVSSARQHPEASPGIGTGRRIAADRLDRLGGRRFRYVQDTRPHLCTESILLLSSP